MTEPGASAATPPPVVERRVEMPRHAVLPAGPVTVEGYSRSTVATFFYLPELSALFDVGACSGTAAAASDAFVSHVHIDHAQALPYYASHRNMLRMAPGRIHVPVGTGQGVRSWIDQVASLQGPGGGRFDYQLTEMAPGEERPVRGRHVVRAFETDHSVPSIGFTVYARREKLRPAYAGLPGHEIGRRKAAGEPVTQVEDRPVFTYLGDTAPSALDRHPEIGESQVLLMECTFLSPEHVENARETKHLHLRDIVERAPLLRSERVILTHFSMRYRMEEVREWVRRALPADLAPRVELFA